MGIFSLKDKVAIITGGNGGIGFAMAKSIGQAGASVVIAGRNDEKNKKATSSLNDSKINCMSIQVDVDCEKSCQIMVDKTLERFNKIDILVNNAGTNIRKRPEQYSLKEWTSIINTNLISMFICSKICYKHFVENKSGKIINIGSMHSLFGAPLGSAYSASKGGVVQLTKSLANTWALQNIQVNAILPGYIDTKLTKQARLDIPTLEENVKKRTPAGRWGVPEDLGGISVFLSSDASNFITGTSIPVDGGYSING